MAAPSSYEPLPEPSVVLDAENKGAAAGTLWDLALVFESGDDKTMKVRCKGGDEIRMLSSEYSMRTIGAVEKVIRKAGLETTMYRSLKKDKVICLVGASEKRLLKEADRTEYPLQLDPKQMIELGASHGLRLAKIAKAGKVVELGEAADDVEIPSAFADQDTWDCVYGPYRDIDPDLPREQTVWRQDLYMKFPVASNPKELSLLRELDRIKLILSVLEAPTAVHGAGLRLNKLIKKNHHPLLAYFPLHNEKDREHMDELTSVWYATFDLPTSHIRNYFGEQVALYFAFITFYVRWLILPGVLGAALFVWQMVTNQVDVWGIVPYGIFCCLFWTGMLEFWKRREARYRYWFGMSKFTEQEQPRPEYKGNWAVSEIDGRIEENFDWKRRLIRQVFSHSVIWTLICVVVACVVGIFIFRAIMVKQSGAIGGYIAAVVNTLQIQVLNFVYNKVAHVLNDFENHRTESQYENALIAKSFLFRFVNSYNSLFYIAFLKRYDTSANGECGEFGCIEQLQQQLATIIITNMVINIITELGIPYLKSRLKTRENEQRRIAEDKRSPAEAEFDLQAYSGTFYDFESVVIEYGYVSLFVVAFPLAPLLAIFTNMIDSRLDIYQLLHLTRRPHPRGAASIGTWYTILEIMGYIAVITNLAVIVFETGMGQINLADGDIYARCLIFIFAEHAVFLIKFMLSYFVPDVPKYIQANMARQEHIVDILINGEEEDDEEVNADALKAVDDAELEAALRDAQANVHQANVHEACPKHGWIVHGFAHENMASAQLD